MNFFRTTDTTDTTDTTIWKPDFSDRETMSLYAFSLNTYFSLLAAVNDDEKAWFVFVLS